MNIIIINFTRTIVVASMMILASTAAVAYKPMPPVFKLENDAAEVLRKYPLGVLHRREAFAHHGGPVKKLTLPNGNSGWLYKVGEQAGIPNVYVLEISREGYVIDVLHKDVHYKAGHSAIQYQFLSDRDVELRTSGPGPGR